MVLKRVKRCLFDLAGYLRRGHVRKNDLKCIQILLCKIRNLRELHIFALESPGGDSALFDPNDQRWLRLREVTSYETLGDSEEVSKALDSFLTNVDLGIAVVSKTFTMSPRVSKKLLVGFYLLLYRANKNKSFTQAELARSLPEIEILKSIWSLLDSKLGEKLVSVSIPHVPFAETIYIPRVTSDPLASDEEPRAQLGSGHYVTMVGNDPSCLCVNFSLFPDENKKRVPIRVLSPFPIPSILQHKKSSNSRLCAFEGSESPVKCLASAMVIHFHGGGFISMSSNAHQRYTRQWVNGLQIPVFSVKYRLSPEFPFPAAVEDAWQAYCWITRFTEKLLGIRSESVVLAGDSIGGNLALAVMLRVLQSDEVVPKGLLLSCPLGNLVSERFTPSLLLAVDDRLLPYSFLKTALYLYVNGSDPNSALLSPGLAPVGWFEGFPKVRLITGDKDPLYDDTVKLTEKLLDAGVDVELKVYEGGTHGLLGFAAKGGMIRCGSVVEDSIVILKELLD